MMAKIQEKTRINAVGCRCRGRGDKGITACNDAKEQK